jgi:hypothetical protein
MAAGASSESRLQVRGYRPTPTETFSRARKTRPRLSVGAAHVCFREAEKPNSTSKLGRIAVRQHWGARPDQCLLPNAIALQFSAHSRSQA